MTALGEPRGIAEAIVANVPVTIAWAAGTDIGRKRSHNEDSLLAGPAVFAVADGMGGHAAGDVASRIVVEQLAGLGPVGAVSIDDIVAALEGAAAELAKLAEELGEGAGTTVTGAALGEHQGEAIWLVFNIGDSRTYVIEDGEAWAVTRDHSVVHELVLAGLWPKGREAEHPAVNVVTRAIGFGESAVPDVTAVPVRAGSRLLLCSDGLSGEVPSPQLDELVVAAPDPDAAVVSLIAAALDAGGRDNVTAIVIDVIEVGGTPT